VTPGSPEDGFEHIRYPCPQCDNAEILVTFRRPGIVGLFCERCECSWSADERRHQADRRRAGDHEDQERRVNDRRGG
jgi:hypothetical protein